MKRYLRDNNLSRTCLIGYTARKDAQNCSRIGPRKTPLQLLLPPLTEQSLPDPTFLSHWLQSCYPYWWYLIGQIYLAIESRFCHLKVIKEFQKY